MTLLNNGKIIDSVYKSFDVLLEKIVSYNSVFPSYKEHLKIFIKYRCDINHNLIKKNKIIFAAEFLNIDAIILLKEYGYLESIDNLKKAYDIAYQQSMSTRKIPFIKFIEKWINDLEPIDLT